MVTTIARPDIDTSNSVTDSTASAFVDVFELLGDRADDFELIRGELREVEPVGGRHGSVGSRFTHYLTTFVYPDDLGDVYTSDTRFVIAESPRTVVRPDVSVILAARLPPKNWIGDIPIAPDLAVEVVSPSNRQPEMLDKIALYLAAGTRLFWLARPERRTVTVFRPDAPARVIAFDGELDGEDVLPGFRLPLGNVFRPRDR